MTQKHKYGKNFPPSLKEDANVRLVKVSKVSLLAKEP